MRLFTSIIAAAAVLVMSTSASALNIVARDITVDGSPVVGNVIDLDLGAIGSVIEVGVVIENDDLNGTPENSAVQGLGVSAFNYNTAVTAFSDGQTTNEKVLATNCFPGAGCFDGMDNLTKPDPAAGATERDLAESEIGTNGLRVQLFNLASVGAPGTGTGAIDFGVDGDKNTNISDGDVHAFIRFTVTGAGTSIINFGTGYEGDGIVLPDASIIQANGDLVTVNVIPEPGTALLMGLGLTGLAFAGRRR